jgi:aquaporin TIP/aquaporin related protein
MRVSLSSYFAELVGTFFFILSILASAGNPYIIGAALALVVLLIGGISGGHVNPAVSFTMFMKGSLSSMELMYYVIAQLAGGLGALYAFRATQ